MNEQTDIYSLGAVLYELLAGHPPFEAEHYAEVLMRILREPFPRIEAVRDDIPAAVVELLVRATARHRSERFARMEDLARAANAAHAALG